MEMPMGLGVPTGPRGGTHRDRGSNIQTLRYHRYTGPIGPRGGTHRDRGSNVPTPRVPSVPRQARWNVRTYTLAVCVP